MFTINNFIFRFFSFAFKKISHIEKILSVQIPFGL
ncbi:hypothetical protein X975_17710, partial [Stegodyphus mimosarum]